MRTELLPLLLCCTLASAAPAATESTAESLGRIESQTLLLKAQERQLAVRLQIAQQQNDINARQAEVAKLAQPSRAGDPGVLAVEGIGATAVATLLLDNGGTVEVASGDALPNGMTVLSVRHNEVLVRNAKQQRIRLAAVSPPVGAPAPAAAPALPALPRLMLPPPAPSRGAGQ